MEENQSYGKTESNMEEINIDYKMRIKYASSINQA